jgi:hypothetical protein
MTTSTGEQGRGREIGGRDLGPVRPHGQRQHLQRFLQPPLVLEEVPVRQEAEAEAGKGLRSQWDRVGNAEQVRALGQIGWQLPEVPADGVELPEQAVAGSIILVASEQPIDQTRHQVGTEREPG